MLRRAAPTVTDAVVLPTALYQVPTSRSWTCHGRGVSDGSSLTCRNLGGEIGDPFHIVAQ